MLYFIRIRNVEWFCCLGTPADGIGYAARCRRRCHPWHKTLSVHEMRHVKQMYSLNSGTIGALSWIFGQQAVGLAAGFVHPWIFEGDAVWAETHYSFSGRGRSANFFNHYYTFSVTGKNHIATTSGY